MSRTTTSRIEDRNFSPANSSTQGQGKQCDPTERVNHKPENGDFGPGRGVKAQGVFNHHSALTERRSNQELQTALTKEIARQSKLSAQKPF
jgi:hypothetical protein